MWTVLAMCAVGALIGWGTNLIAVRLLFKPIEPIRIPIIGYEIQGLIPKRRAEIARSVAATIEKDLLSLETILEKIIAGIDKKQVLEMLEERLVTVIKANLPTLMQPFAGAIQRQIHELIEKQGEQLLMELTEALIHKAVTEVRVSDLIEERILALDLVQLEDMIIALAKKELKQIEVLGGVLGFAVGLIQGLITLVFA